MSKALRITTLIFVAFIIAFSAVSMRSVRSTEVEHNAFLPIVQHSSALPGGLVYSDAQGLWLVEANGIPKLLVDHKNGTLSPDGKQVAYWFYSNGEGSDDIWLADLSTGEHRNLTNSPDIVDRYPQWWPARDGVIIFGTDDEVRPGNDRLTMVDENGNNYQVLDEQGYGPFALSPDGQIIAYLSPYEYTGTLYHWNGDVEILDPADYGVGVGKMFGPAWSPDGEYIAWEIGYAATDESGKSGVAVFDLEGKMALLLHLYERVSPTCVPQYISWSPDGEWLAFVTWGEQLNDIGMDVGQTAENPMGGPLPNLWVFQVHGTEEISLGIGIDPVWSPDGRELVYTRSNISLDGGIWLVDIPSGVQRRILPQGAAAVEWRPIDE